MSPPNIGHPSVRVRIAICLRMLKQRQKPEWFWWFKRGEKLVQLGGVDFLFDQFFCSLEQSLLLSILLDERVEFWVILINRKKI